MPPTSCQSTSRVCCSMVLRHPPAMFWVRTGAVWALSHPDSSVISLKCCCGLSKACGKEPGGGQTLWVSPHHSKTRTCCNFSTPARTWSQRGPSVAPSSADPGKYRSCRWQYSKKERNGSVGKGGEGEGMGQDYCCKREARESVWLDFCERSAEASFGLGISLPKRYFKCKVCLWLFLSLR